MLPYSIRVILESAVRNCDESQITSKDIKNILNWPETHRNNVEIPFLPSRVILQDFTYCLFLITNFDKFFNSIQFEVEFQLLLI